MERKLALRRKDRNSRLNNSKTDEGIRSSLLSFLREFPTLLATAFIIALLIRWLVVQSFYIPSQSMEPTLSPGDRILVNKFIYRFTSPKPGDIVVFALPQQDNRDFIKRIVACEGDTVAIKNGKLYVNGKLNDSYPVIPEDYSNMAEQKVKNNHVFVMGDNRPNSVDSRYIGQIPERNIIGKAFIVFWPLDRIKIIN
ncbi:MAG: signal peptidase I [Actinomycetota bacterium]|nr:signal peptidase I [Actinomycetota bacterium]